MKIKVLPHAGIVPQGDCGACCVGTIAGIQVKEVYDVYGQIIGLPYHAIITLLQRLSIEYENWLPKYHMIDNREDWFPFGYPAYQNWIEWSDVSSKRTKRNMVGIAHVNLHGKANLGPYVDHWVLITVEERGTSWQDKIVCVSCPTKGYYEVTAKDFLFMYGGYNTIWVKPKTKLITL